MSNPFQDTPFADNSPKHIEAIAKAAKERFGDVLTVTIKEVAPHGEFYFVACKRTEAPCKDRPYMTITAKYSFEEGTRGQVSFFWGHYDLTVEQVMNEIEIA